jgi:hypothetical protein
MAHFQVSADVRAEFVLIGVLSVVRHFITTISENQVPAVSTLGV